MLTHTVYLKPAKVEADRVAAHLESSALIRLTDLQIGALALQHKEPEIRFHISLPARR